MARNAGLLWLCLLGVFTVASCSDNELPFSEPSKYDLNLDCIQALREQVNAEMHASLVYMQMAAHFDQNRVARKGFAKFFDHSSKEEREHAQKLIDYLNSRGASFVGFNVEMPKFKHWESGTEALKEAITLEKTINDKLYEILDSVTKGCKDHHLHNYLEEEFLKEQVRSIDELSRFVSILYPMQNDLTGEYLFDLELQNMKFES